MPDALPSEQAKAGPAKSGAPNAAPRRPSWELLAVLRFVLAVIVLATHFAWFFDSPPLWAHLLGAFGGKAAVVGFLLVSGYSISASLTRDKDGFYRRRLLRVYPLYVFTILLATLLEHAAAGPIKVPAQTLVGLGWVTTIGNLLFLQTFAVKPVVFAGPVWSLAIEVFYYALAPFLARLSRRTLLALIVVSAGIFLLPKRDELGGAYMILRLNAFRYLWCWVLGFMLEREPFPTRLTLDRPLVLVSLAATVLLMFSEATPEPLAALTYLGSLAIVLGARRVTFPKALRGAANYLGDLSYPLYLLHLPTFILGYAFLGLRAPAALIGTALAVTLVAYHLVDRNLKQRLLAPLLFRPRAPKTAPDVDPATG